MKDELSTSLINSIETLSKRLEKLEEQLKKNGDAIHKNNASMHELNSTILTTNKIFDQVSTGVRDLYEKVKAMELWAKVLGNLGPLLGGLGKK